MSTLSQMRSRIADDLDRTDLSSQIDTAINRAIRYYASKEFWFNQTTGTFVTTASQKAYGTTDGLPSDIASVTYVEISINDTDYRLTPRTYAYIQEIDPSTYIGDPDDYAWFENKMYLYPVPDASYTVTVSYAKSYVEMTTDGASNDFTTEAEDLIESRARWWINSRIIHDDDDALRSKALEMDALQSLYGRTENLVMSKRIKPTDF